MNATTVTIFGEVGPIIGLQSVQTAIVEIFVWKKEEIALNPLVRHQVMNIQ